MANKDENVQCEWSSITKVNCISRKRILRILLQSCKYESVSMKQHEVNNVKRCKFLLNHVTCRNLLGAESTFNISLCDITNILLVYGIKN